jgi:hypothetical protein
MDMSATETSMAARQLEPRLREERQSAATRY